MQSPAHIIVLTLMMRTGSTGVQTHFNSIAGYAANHGLKVSVINPHQFPRWVRRFSGAIGKALIRVSREQAVLVDRFFSRIYLRLMLGKALAEAAKNNETAVVYAQDLLSARVALDLRAQGHDFRLVGVIHFNVSEAQEFVDKGIAAMGGKLCQSLTANEQFVLPRLDQIIFVSHFMQQRVAERLPQIAAVPQEVIPNFPLLPERENDSGASPQGDLIAIGTLEPRKNQRFLLQVLAQCNAVGKRYRLTLAGDGPDRAMLEQESRRLGLESQIRFLGHTPNAAALIALHKILIHPARMENLPITLLEGLGARTPVFAAPVGGIPEVIEDGREGHYLDLDNPHDAARKLISVLEDPSEWLRMSANAQAAYAGRFHPDVLGPRWIMTLVGA